MIDSVKSLVSEESFGRCVTLVQGLIPEATALALCDETGQAIRFIDFEAGAEITASVGRLCNEVPEWPSATEPRTYDVGDRRLLVKGLCNSRSEVVASLLISIGDSSTQTPGNSPLLVVAECLEQEMRLGAELTSMTTELTERYEELNLVYHTEDQVNYFRQGQEALKDLTKNCLDYLDVGLSALILKNKDIALSFDHCLDPIPDARRVRSRLADDLYEWVRQHGKTVVINETTDSLASSIAPGIPHRVLCCPIFESSGDVVGILATVNSHDKPIFTNSDRNLLQIMARKAAKIIAANYDPLTGLMNRNGYEYFLASALEQVRGADAQKGLMHINIDQLHIINDTVGHAAGDEVIRSVAGIIDSMKGDSNILSRLGGDEFGLLVNGYSYTTGEFAERICQTVANSTVEFDGEKYRVTVSIGVAMITKLSKSVAQVISTAELACSVAKEQGQNRVETYRLDNADVLRREEQVHFVSHIQNALANNSFELYSQPIQALVSDSRDHHTEVLLRLVDESGKITEPNKFIPAAERYHLMPSIDRWVVNKTLTMLSHFEERALHGGSYAINLSGQSLGENGFLEFVHEEIRKSGIPPKCLCFEVTETAAVAKMENAIRFMNSVRGIGCSFSLDDFGSGTSSFGYLKRLPVDYLKIDGSIITDIVTDEASAAMVFAINQVGHTMNLRTIAEYVDSAAIMARLKEIGVDYVQGFAIGRPVPFADRLNEIMVEAAAVAS